MATFSTPSDGSYDDLTGRSPRSLRNPPLNRPNSRPLENHPTMQGSMFANGGHGGSLRFDAMREGYGPGIQGGYAGNVNFPYDPSAAQTWNASSMQYNAMNNMSQGNAYGPSRSVKPSRGRPPLNELWEAPPGQLGQMGPPPPPGSLMSGNRQPSATGRLDPTLDDDELIPTAIVIKNIPFAVKKEQLVQLMVDMNLPLPYAFNYHFDNGVFRGLAFANFTSPTETEQVIQALNHLELSGRKLRVEYKKMLPLAERERIEREKRERRGQLEEQHRPLAGPQIHTQLSMSSIPRNTPSPLSARNSGKQSGALEMNMNDPQTLEFYTQLTIFKNNTEPETLIFSQDLEPQHRRTIHTLAHHMGMLHTSHGVGEARQVHVQRPPPGSNVSPNSGTAANPFGPNRELRPNLARTSTQDFHDGNRYEGPNYNTLRGQASVGMLEVTNNAFDTAANSNLRNAKSFADLRSWSPSPAPSAASFPAALQTNGARLQQQMNDSAASNTPNLTPSASNTAIGINRDEPFLISGFNGLSVSNGSTSQTSPRRQRSFFGNSPWGDDQSYPPTAPIGSKRTVSIGGENASGPIRQSRGPGPNNTIGFRRQNGRGSDELRTAASAIAE